jgi:hypothetical protein
MDCTPDCYCNKKYGEFRIRNQSLFTYFENSRFSPNQKGNGTKLLRALLYISTSGPNVHVTPGTSDPRAQVIRAQIVLIRYTKKTEGTNKTRWNAMFWDHRLHRENLNKDHMKIGTIFNGTTQPRARCKRCEYETPLIENVPAV